MKIAKIIKSNSHIDYVGRVVDELDAENAPSDEDYGFAQFVNLPLSESEEIVGVIYNSLLINPDYANFGPRLSPKPELGNFSPDYLNEQGFLIGILLLGTRNGEGKIQHGVPRKVVPAGQDVYKVSGCGREEISHRRKRLSADSLLFADRRARRTFRRSVT